MKDESHEPLSEQAVSPWALPATDTRHDGWTGERMAMFCEALAETGLVVDACLAAGKSTNTAYALRRRNPLFAAAWEAALTIARERLADTLLARSIEGNVEQYYRDGELVAERRVVDNRLGLAILRRLDRLAEMGMAGSTAGTLAGQPRRTPACNPQPVDWDLALSALRSGEEEAIAEALAMFDGREGDKAHETHDPRNALGGGDDEDDNDNDGLDLSDRCWKDDISGGWLTNFPPPSGFNGYESCDYGNGNRVYERECTAEEVAILEADIAREVELWREHEARMRDAWFALLKEEAEEAGITIQTNAQSPATISESRSAATGVHSLATALPGPK